MAANYGGYDYSFVEKNLERFTCSTICTKVLRNPRLTECCGQVFCESCLKYWFTKHRKKSCPHCRAEGEEFTHILDKRLKREIDSLKIYCSNKEEGCEWVGEVEYLKNHLESDNGCGYVKVECPNKCIDIIKANLIGYTPLPLTCTMKRKDLENHCKNLCYLRPYKCEYCGHEDTFENITGILVPSINPFEIDLLSEKDTCRHYDDCPEIPLRCPNECGEKHIKRKDMEDHRSQCPEEEVECPYKCTVDKKTYHNNEGLLSDSKVENTAGRKRSLDIDNTQICGSISGRGAGIGPGIGAASGASIGAAHGARIGAVVGSLTAGFAAGIGAGVGTSIGAVVGAIIGGGGLGASTIGRKTPLQTKPQIQETFTVKRKKLTKHIEVCELRPYQCEHCELKDTYTAIRKHYRQCEMLPLECPNKCGVRDIRRKDMEDHRSQCPKEEIECPFEEVGCKEKIVRRKLEQHVFKNQLKHSQMIMGAYKEMRKENMELKKELADTKKALRKTTKDLQQIKEKITHQKKL